MTENTKVFIGILAGIATALLALVIGGFFWLQHRNDGLAEAIEESVLEGEAIGRVGDQWACVWAAYDRSKGCGRVAPVCEMKVAVFLRHCLDHAAPGPKFCEGVPADGDVMHSAEWAYDNCDDLTGRDHDRCAGIFQTVQSYCLVHRHDKPARTTTSTAI